MPNQWGDTYPRTRSSTSCGPLSLRQSLSTPSLSWSWSTHSVLPWNSTDSRNCTHNSWIFSMSYSPFSSPWSSCSSLEPLDSRYFTILRKLSHRLASMMMIFRSINYSFRSSNSIFRFYPPLVIFPIVWFWFFYRLILFCVFSLIFPFRIILAILGTALISLSSLAA